MTNYVTNYDRLAMQFLVTVGAWATPLLSTITGIHMGVPFNVTPAEWTRLHHLNRLTAEVNESVRNFWSRRPY